MNCKQFDTHIHTNKLGNKVNSNGGLYYINFHAAAG